MAGLTAVVSLLESCRGASEAASRISDSRLGRAEESVRGVWEFIGVGGLGGRDAAPEGNGGGRRESGGGVFVRSVAPSSRGVVLGEMRRVSIRHGEGDRGAYAGEFA